MKKICYGLIACCTVLLAGCLGQVPPQQKYMLNASCPAAYQNNRLGPSLQINTIQVVSQYSDNEFVYRTSSINAVSDYYHVFFNLPSDQLTQITVRCLNNTGHFSALGNSLLPLSRANYILSGTVQSLYADYQDRNHPAADLSIRYVLVRTSDAKIVLNKTYTQNVPLRAKTSDALVYAWNQGLTQIMKQLQHDVRKAV